MIAQDWKKLSDKEKDKLKEEYNREKNDIKAKRGNQELIDDYVERRDAFNQ